jgi:hypothetical protein
VAKKPLKMPDVPIGPQCDFFLFFQDLVRHRTCDESLSVIVKERGLYCSRQVLHRALTGPDLPKRDFVELVAKQVGATSEEVSQLLQAYDLANDDRINRLRNVTLSVSRPIASAQRQAGASAEAPEVEAQQRRKEFATMLLQIYRAAGSPPLLEVSAMSEKIGRLGGTSMQGRSFVSKSSLSSWLTGQTVPARGQQVMTLARILLRSAHDVGDVNSLPDERAMLAAWQEARASADFLRSQRTRETMKSRPTRTRDVKTDVPTDPE